MWINLSQAEYTTIEELWERYLFYITRSQLPTTNTRLVRSDRIRAHYYEDQYWLHIGELKEKYLYHLYSSFLGDTAQTIPFESWNRRGAPHQIHRIQTPPAPRGNHLLEDRDIINW